jgi:ATP-dependent protease HslVU (ClpYQ) peptidase subunit
MTTIIAVEEKTGVTVAADSRVSGGPLNDGWVQKIVKNGPFLFAAAGHLRAIQILEYAHLPYPPATNKDNAIDRFVSLELVPAIIEAFTKVDDSESREGSTFLAVVRGRVYEISGGDGAWLRSDRGLYAIGSGSMYALGALEAGASVEKAIRIASTYDGDTNDSVNVVTA